MCLSSSLVLLPLTFSAALLLPNSHLMSGWGGWIVVVISDRLLLSVYCAEHDLLRTVRLFSCCSLFSLPPPLFYQRKKHPFLTSPLPFFHKSQSVPRAYVRVCVCVSLLRVHPPLCHITN
uniref:Putative secreted protein n=1 Tax=Anopheles darlingi TaxID=43151 RepID=A0A2M4DDF4_ANODA